MIFHVQCGFPFSLLFLLERTLKHTAYSIHTRFIIWLFLHPPTVPCYILSLFSCLSFINSTCTVIDTWTDTRAQWHIIISTFLPEKAGKMAGFLLTWHILIASENVAKYKGPVGFSSLYSLETKPGSAAWSGWPNLWIEPAIQRCQTLLTSILQYIPIRHCLDEYHETLKRKRKEKVQLVRTLPSC